MSAKKKTVIPMREVIAVRAKELGLENIDLARTLGYTSGNVIAMIKSGDMRVPKNRLAEFAQALRLDPLWFMTLANEEYGLGLGPLIDALSKRTPVTLNEEKLIRRLRSISNGRDLDLEEYPQEQEAILKLYENAVLKDEKTHSSIATQLRSKARSALASGDRAEEEREKKAA